MVRFRQGTAKNLARKRRLRSEMTQAEKKLWSKLRSNQFYGLSFRRQHGVGPYIVDFFCSTKSIVIEVDGDVHAYDQQIKKDERREKYLKSLGLNVVRYYNDDIINNINGVLEDLNRKLTLPPQTPPYKGGETEGG